MFQQALLAGGSSEGVAAQDRGEFRAYLVGRRLRWRDIGRRWRWLGGLRSVLQIAAHHLLLCQFLLPVTVTDLWPSIGNSFVFNVFADIVD
jgi:hypothetical protein